MTEGGRTGREGWRKSKGREGKEGERGEKEEGRMGGKGKGRGCAGVGVLKTHKQFSLFQTLFIFSNVYFFFFWSWWVTSVRLS